MTAIMTPKPCSALVHHSSVKFIPNTPAIKVGTMRMAPHAEIFSPTIVRFTFRRLESRSREPSSLSITLSTWWRVRDKCLCATGAVLVQVLERGGQGLHRLARKLVDLTLDVARSALQYRFLNVPEAFIDGLDPLLVYDLEENRPRAFYDAIGLLLHPS